MSEARRDAHVATYVTNATSLRCFRSGLAGRQRTPVGEARHACGIPRFSMTQGDAVPDGWKEAVAAGYGTDGRMLKQKVVKMRLPRRFAPRNDARVSGKQVGTGRSSARSEIPLPSYACSIPFQRGAALSGVRRGARVRVHPAGKAIPRSGPAGCRRRGHERPALRPKPSFRLPAPVPATPVP